MKILTVCIDANVYVSAIGWGGKPLKIVERALDREFLLVTCPQILAEVRRNLIGKLELNADRVNRLINDLTEISTVFVPGGSVEFIRHKADNLVLEAALMGGCDVLVTGDKKHLLPLKIFQGIKIENPAQFLERFEASN